MTLEILKEVLSEMTDGYLKVELFIRNDINRHTINYIAVKYDIRLIQALKENIRFMSRNDDIEYQDIVRNNCIGAFEIEVKRDGPGLPEEIIARRLLQGLFKNRIV